MRESEIPAGAVATHFGGPATPELAAALVQAMAEIQNPVMDREVKSSKFSYSYATLGACLDVVRPVLAKYGLCVIQPISCDDEEIRVATVVIHSSGAAMGLGTVAFRRQATPQENGSIMTYARRYGLMSAFSIVGDDDDDATAAMPGRADTVIAPRRMSPKQEIQALLRHINLPDGMKPGPYLRSIAEDLGVSGSSEDERDAAVAAWLREAVGAGQWQ